jgi:transcriptional regulator
MVAALSRGGHCLVYVPIGPLRVRVLAVAGGPCAPETAPYMTNATQSPFERYSDADIVDQIREFPLAWICPVGGDPLLSTLLPLLPETDSQGQLRTLLGHIPRRNPLVQALAAQPRVCLLFTGPQAYVSPACVSDPAWAPTWNFAQVRIEATVRFNENGIDEALHTLTDTMEAREPTGWSPEAMGARYSPMSRAVVAFRTEVNRHQARFKLGQDEKPERLREILERHSDPALVRWMRRFNPGRC